MKKFLTGIIVVAMSAFSSSAVMAHAAHVAGESLHGPLHLEHVLGLLVIGVAALLMKIIRSK